MQDEGELVSKQGGGFPGLQGDRGAPKDFIKSSHSGGKPKRPVYVKKKSQQQARG